MNITSEIISTIYERAFQYYLALKGYEPDSIRVESDGTITCVYTTYCCGESDSDYDTIYAHNLTEDLDEVVNKRKIAEEIKRQEDLVRRQKEEIERQEREKRNRKEQYERLKKEFG